MEDQRVKSWWHLASPQRQKNQQTEALLSAGQRRLKAEGAGRAVGINITEDGIKTLPPVASVVHLSPAIYSSPSKVKSLLYLYVCISFHYIIFCIEVMYLFFKYIMFVGFCRWAWPFNKALNLRVKFFTTCQHS